MKNDQLNKMSVLPFNRARIGSQNLVSNVLGCWDFMTDAEFTAFHGFRVEPGSAFALRLKERGLMVDASNMESLLQGYRAMNAHLFHDTALHIAVATTRCNLRCGYCQAKADEVDMSVEIAAKIGLYLLGVKATAVTLEFQGGEPLLNWPVVAFLIGYIRKANANGKRITIVVVSNALLLDKKKMAFLAENDVDLCVSLDGPARVHDANRKDAGDRPTHKAVLAKIADYKKSTGRRVGLLATITRHSLGQYREIIDEYVRLGETNLALRPVNQMGSACASWGELGYSPEEFMDFYKKSLAYMLDLNRKGVRIKERLATVILTKVLLKKDPGYVDMMNPCGAGRASLAYMPDGGVYPCDEARMVAPELFRLGNVLKDSYDDVLQSETLLALLESSCAQLWTEGSAFSPWIGYCPVVNYATQKNVIPRIACSPAHQILEAQFTYIFELMQDREHRQILESWVKGDTYEKER